MKNCRIWRPLSGGVTAALLTVGSWTSAMAGISDLFESLQPITMTSSPDARWLTSEYTLEIPLAKEHHLLRYYVENESSFTDGIRTFRDLVQSFDQVTTRRKGYPLLVDGTDELDEEAIKYWIEKQQAFHDGIRASAIFSSSITVDTEVDHAKTHVDRRAKKLTLVYRVKRELVLKDAHIQIEDLPLEASLPLNLHKQYFSVLIDSELQATALDHLRAGSLPRPMLAWQRGIRSVRHACLGSRVSGQVLTFDRFLSALDMSGPGCHVNPGELTTVKTVKVSEPVPEANPYPQYHELFKDGKLDVLIALDPCNEDAHECSENALSHSTNITELIHQLEGSGFMRRELSQYLSEFSKNAAGLDVTIRLLTVNRPVYYQAMFWEEFRQADVVIASRVPLYRRHLTRAYAAKYQVLVGPRPRSIAWARLLPQLDYALKSFDAVDMNVDALQPEVVSSFVRQLADVYRYYDQSARKWQKNVSWRHLMQGLADRSSAPSDAALAARSGGAPVLHYARLNDFKPGLSGAAIDFSKQPEVDAYGQLLQTEKVNNRRLTVDRQLTYLYLTLAAGVRNDSFDALREDLKTVCKALPVDLGARDQYFFARDCSPRMVLTAGNMEINGVAFPRGSVLDLYYGKRGVPKETYMSDAAEIGGFTFKSYYQDNGGVVKFYRKNGRVKQGHLAAKATYKDLPLLGGKGTCMVRFYENGSIMTAQLRQDADYQVGSYQLRLRGGWRGPHQVSFHPNGSLACAYLAEPTTMNGMLFQSVEANSRRGGKNRVCFHANGQLQSGRLAADVEVNGAQYLAGTSVSFSNRGALSGPIYRVIGDDEYYWGALFPKGSTYAADSATAFPTWIRLAGELNLRKHRFPAGSQIWFRGKGSLEKFITPPNATAKIAMAAHTFVAPPGVEIKFDRWVGVPQSAKISGPATFGGLTFLPQGEGSDVFFHASGRVSSGVLAEDALIYDPHYGEVPVKGGHRVQLSGEGYIRAGTLSAPYTFHYKPQDRHELPRGINCSHNWDLCYRPVAVPTGAVFRLGYRANLSSVKLDASATMGKIFAAAGSTISYDDAHRISSVRFSAEGGRVGPYRVGPSVVRMHPTGEPQSLRLVMPSQWQSIKMPAATQITFYSSGSFKSIAMGGGDMSSFSVDGRDYVKGVQFSEGGKVLTGFFADDVAYGGVQLAGWDTCIRTHVMALDGKQERCRVSFYRDGKSVLRAVAAQPFEYEGHAHPAGQVVEFDEDGHLFLP